MDWGRLHRERGGTIRAVANSLRNECEGWGTLSGNGADESKTGRVWNPPFTVVPPAINVKDSIQECPLHNGHGG